jgi:aprataxin
MLGVRFGQIIHLLFLKPNITLSEPRYLVCSQVPSMRQLHLHIISQDFNSTSLKNKKHWNSFTTQFFCDSVDVIEEMEQHGSATTSSDEKVLAMELRCHRCRSAHPNIPKLKSHIESCKSPFPSHLQQKNRLISSSTMPMDCT